MLPRVTHTPVLSSSNIINQCYGRSVYYVDLIANIMVFDQSEFLIVLHPNSELG